MCQAEADEQESKQTHSAFMTFIALGRDRHRNIQEVICTKLCRQV